MVFRPLLLAVTLIAAMLLIQHITPISKAVWIIVMVIALICCLAEAFVPYRRTTVVPPQ